MSLAKWVIAITITKTTTPAAAEAAAVSCTEFSAFFQSNDLFTLYYMQWNRNFECFFSLFDVSTLKHIIAYINDIRLSCLVFFDNKNLFCWFLYICCCCFSPGQTLQMDLIIMNGKFSQFILLWVFFLFCLCCCCSRCSKCIRNQNSISIRFRLEWHHLIKWYFKLNK